MSGYSSRNCMYYSPLSFEYEQWYKDNNVNKMRRKGGCTEVVKELNKKQREKNACPEVRFCHPHKAIIIQMGVVNMKSSVPGLFKYQVFILQYPNHLFLKHNLL